MTDQKAPVPGRVKLNNVRIAWPQVFKQGEYEGEASGFSVKCVIEPGSPHQKLLEDTMLAMAKSKWSDKGETMFKRLRAEARTCIKYHNPEAPSEDPAFQSAHQFSCRSNVRPVVVGRDKAALQEEDGVIYSGCHANVIADIWAQDSGYGKRLNAKLKLVQFVKDGEPFSADRPVDMSEVDDLTDGIDDDAPGLDGLIGDE